MTPGMACLQVSWLVLNNTPFSQNSTLLSNSTLVKLASMTHLLVYCLPSVKNINSL